MYKLSYDDLFSDRGSSDALGHGDGNAGLLEEGMCVEDINTKQEEVHVG